MGDRLEYCSSCKRNIDPDTCHCGDSLKGHTWEHSFVAMGCVCGYDRAPFRSAELNEQRRELDAARLLYTELAGAAGVDAHRSLSPEAFLRAVIEKVKHWKDRHGEMVKLMVKLDTALEKGNGKVEWVVPGVQVLELKTEYLYPSGERGRLQDEEAFRSYVNKVAADELSKALLRDGAVYRKDDGEKITHEVKVWRP